MSTLLFHFPLVFQQKFLSSQAAAVAAEVAVFVHDSVTGNHDGYAIEAIGSTYGPHRFAIARRFGNRLILASFAERNLEQCVPNPSLKFRTGI